MAEPATPPRRIDGEADRLAPYDGRFGRSFDEEVNVRKVALSAVVLLVVCALVMFVTWLMIPALLPEPEGPPVSEANERQLPPLPRLQTEPTGDLADLRREMAEQLHGYGWVDEESQVVYIPVEKAIDLYLQRRNAGSEADAAEADAAEADAVLAGANAEDATAGEVSISGEADRP